MFRHNLGDKVRDKISGFTGIVTTRAEHLYGCARYWISPQELKDGKPVDGMWVDEDSLDVVEARVIARQHYRVVEETETVRPRELSMAGGPSSQPAAATGPVTR